MLVCTVNHRLNKSNYINGSSMKMSLSGDNWFFLEMNSAIFYISVSHIFFGCMNRGGARKIS